MPKKKTYKQVMKDLLKKPKEKPKEETVAKGLGGGKFEKVVKI